MRVVLLLLVACAWLAVAVCEVRAGSATVSDSAESSCLICDMAVSVIENGVRNEDESITTLMEKACLIFGGRTRTRCEAIIKFIGPDALALLLKTLSPDAVCSKFGFCKQCRLKPTSSSSPDDEHPGQTAARVVGGLLSMARDGTLPLLVTDDVGGVYSSYKPWVDLDHDGYSPLALFRGTEWRGKDCDELSANVHPGAPLVDGDARHDHNCNGISGKHPSGQPWEERLCANTGARHVTTFGDSASSGFHINPRWLQLRDLSGIIGEALTEMDEPENSWDSGFANDIQGESIYLHMRANNLCNHRQYSNVGKNGADSYSLTEQVHMFNSSRTAAPLLGFIAYIGNDLCQNSLEAMTTAAAFRSNLVNGLQLLDTIVMPDSKIVLLSPVDGTVLWNVMSQRQHPLGVTYEEFYAFLSCTGGNPCWTWLNENEAVRNATTSRAIELGDVLEDLVKNPPALKNIELFYEEFPLDEAFQILEREHRDPGDLIEAVDGFHPSPYAHRLISQLVWQHMNQEVPHFVSPVNPHNAEIQSLFGDQGGY